MHKQCNQHEQAKTIMLYCLAICSSHLKVMLQGTIRNDHFLLNAALECWNNVATLYCPKKSLLRSHGWRVQFLYDNQASYASLFAMKLEPWVIQICLLSLIISNLTTKMNFEKLQHSKFLKTTFIHASLCICCVVYTFFFYVSLNLETITTDCIELHFVTHPL